MTGLVYTAVIATILAALGGLGWLIKDWLHIRAADEAKDQKIAAKDETIERILKEKSSAEQIHKNRPVSDFDTSGRL
jgi:hypothetical protein